MGYEQKDYSTGKTSLTGKMYMFKKNILSTSNLKKLIQTKSNLKLIFFPKSRKCYCKKTLIASSTSVGINSLRSFENFFIKKWCNKRKEKDEQLTMPMVSKYLFFNENDIKDLPKPVKILKIFRFVREKMVCSWNSKNQSIHWRMHFLNFWVENQLATLGVTAVVSSNLAGCQP